MGVPEPYVTYALWMLIKECKAYAGVDIKVEPDPGAPCSKMYHRDYPLKGWHDAYNKKNGKLELIYATLGFKFQKNVDESWAAATMNSTTQLPTRRRRV